MPAHDPSDAWVRPACTAEERRVQFYDRMTEELRRHNLAFRAATRIGPGERVLDIGCGAGESTRDAARMAVGGEVLGVDISTPVLERARQLTDQAGLRNVSYQLADAEVHQFSAGLFDTCISRFGSMFFTDTVAAFTNIGRGLRPGARLVLMVWQDRARNEWSTAIRGAVGATSVTVTGQGDPFSLADPAETTSILAAAGFGDVDFTEVREAVYYGPDVTAAYDFVASMRDIEALLDSLSARQRLRAVIAEHDTGNGVLFDSRAWIITARRG